MGVILIIIIIFFIVFAVPTIIAYLVPDDWFSCKNNKTNEDEIEVKSNFRIELENNLSKYRDFVFEKSKIKTYPIGLRNFDSIKFIDERNLIIFHIYGDKYLDIEYNSNEDYIYEKKRMLEQYEKYKQALEQLNKYYPPHEEHYDDDCDDYSW